MSCTAVKRTHDLLSESPDRADGLVKRCRMSPNAAHMASGLVHRRAAVPSHQLQRGPFQPRTAAESPDTYIQHHIKRRKTKRCARKQDTSDDEMYTTEHDSPAVASGLGGAENTPSSHGKGDEMLFTVHQVRALIDRAVRERERELTEQYNTILEERLAEQFEQFSRFNQDHIHRQMEQSPFSYMS